MDVSFPYAKTGRGLIARHRVLLAVTGLFALYAAAFQHCVLPLPSGETLFVPWYLEPYLAMMFMVGGGYLLFCWSDARERPARMAVFEKRFKGALPGFFCVYLVVCLFSSLKSLIGEINPYRFDPLFLEIERMMHFGNYPQVWLSFIYDYPLGVVFIDKVYFLWFFLMYAYLAWQLFEDSANASRQRFVLAFTLVWIVAGVGVATALSSVGPIFLDHYYHLTDPYSPVLEKLASINNLYGLFAFRFRDLLLGLQSNHQLVDVNAPSAMPSVHVAMAALVCCHSFRYYRRLFPWAAAFLAITALGAVILGWHYAIDVYAGMLLAWLLWRAACFMEPESKKGEGR